MTGVYDKKASLRKAILEKRESIDTRARTLWSRSILDGISALDDYRRADVVMAYAGFGSELQTEEFLRSVLEQGKTLVLPRVNRDERRLDLYEIRDLARDLRPGTWGIREPEPGACPEAAPGVIDFVLVPGVAFDPKGGRLGYGGGYYDNLLGEGFTALPPLVAGAFEIQVVEAIPLQEHDVRVGRIVTEKGHYGPDLHG